MDDDEQQQLQREWINDRIKHLHAELYWHEERIRISVPKAERIRSEIAQLEATLGSATELTDVDLDHVTGGARPSPDAGCRYAPMGGRCYPAVQLRGVNWPLSLRAQWAARYGDK